MKLELDNTLCERYPEIMVNRYQTMNVTCMCWGFECGDGWFTILDQLMSKIQHHIDWKNKKDIEVPQVTFDQVKEKFGSLRIYYSGGDDVIDGMVQMAQSMSKQEQFKEEVYRKQIEKRNFDQIVAERVARNIRLDLAKGTNIDIEC